MRRSADRTHDVPTQIKNPDLVEKRRRQIVDAAVALFVEKGFHKTTTRQIAAAAGFSIGSLYEYVASKEDVLYLVCEAIHDEVEHGVAEALARVTTGRAALAEVIREYFLVCHRMSDLVLLIYQETQSLPAQWRKRVLENEIAITGIFVKVLAKLTATGGLPEIEENSIELVAHNICVSGAHVGFSALVSGPPLQHRGLHRAADRFYPGDQHRQGQPLMGGPRRLSRPPLDCGRINAAQVNSKEGA
jgi:TetR/AcrR family transcriptional regulator, cholesterol catabolism regulator